MVNKALFFIATSTLLLNSCKKDDLSSINKTITVRNNQADLICRIKGNGSHKKFILLLHGGPGSHGLAYSKGIAPKLLEDNFAMIYLDQRGQGVSQGYNTKNKVYMDQLVDDVIAVNKVLRHKFGKDSKIFLMGHSWGGSLGTAVMVTKEGNDAFDGWIEVDGAHDMLMLYNSAVKRITQIAQKEKPNDHIDSIWTETLNKVSLIDTNKTLSINEIEWLNTRGFLIEDKLSELKVLNEPQPSPGTLVSLFEKNLITTTIMGRKANSIIIEKNDFFNFTLTNQLHKITKPTLLLWGKYDFVVPLRLGQTAFNKISSSDKKLIVFDRSGHSPMEREPEKFAYSIIDFINKIQ